MLACWLVLAQTVKLAAKYACASGSGVGGHRSRYLAHAKRALYHLSYDPSLIGSHALTGNTPGTTRVWEPQLGIGSRACWPSHRCSNKQKLQTRATWRGVRREERGEACDGRNVEHLVIRDLELRRPIAVSSRDNRIEVSVA